MPTFPAKSSTSSLTGHTAR